MNALQNRGYDVLSAISFATSPSLGERVTPSRLVACYSGDSSTEGVKRSSTVPRGNKREKQS